MADAAAALAGRGFEVTVFTSGRGYADPSVKYKSREMFDGVDVVRLPFSSFGKKTIAHRLLGQGMFLLQVIFRALFMSRLAAILVSTSPPMASIAALVVHWLRGTPIKFWVMDLNPDQLIEMGKLKPTDLSARAFNWLNRRILLAADEVIALDRFMADRLVAKVDARDKITVMPPWPHSDHLEPVEHADNPFRHQHELDGKFVVMYSGNHGQTTPVQTILDAAVRMQDREELVFMFIGGGAGKQDVERTIREHQPTNIIDLPYQPLDQLRYSLSAADVHLVTMGDSVVGVIHPCKIYGAMALSRPLLLVGPDECHATDIMNTADIGRRVTHGDVDGAIAAIDELRTMPHDQLRAMGERAGEIVRAKYSQRQMIDRFADIVTRKLPSAPPVPAAPVEQP